MNPPRNRNFQCGEDGSVGGQSYVPPAACPRSAYVPARAAARVERIGTARSDLNAALRPANRWFQNSLAWPMECTP